MISYSSDLTDSEFESIKEFFNPQRKRKVDLHVVLNGIFYLLWTGCQWRAIPHQEVVPWQTIYYYFREWKRKGIWEEVLRHLRETERVAEGREATPSAMIIDSQSSKGTRTGEERGVDGGKKTKGRKRHILVDTDGRLVAAHVSKANLADTKGADVLFEKIKDQMPRLEVVFADGTYRGKEWLAKVEQEYGWRVDPLLRKEQCKEFTPEPIRWKVERTFAWFESSRRLSKSYEYLAESEEVMILISHVRLLIRRLDRRTSTSEPKKAEMFQSLKNVA